MVQVILELVRDRWLSAVLSRDTYKLQYESKLNQSQSDTLTPLHEVLKTAARPGTFIYTKVSPTDLQMVAALESTGFRLVDTNVQLAKPLVARDKSNAPEYIVRLATSRDEDGVVDVASTSFVYSRFHSDVQFPKILANKVKGEWARNYFKGERGHMMVVVEREGRIVGFLQLLKSEDKLVIDLVATSQGAQGKGIAKGMIAHAESENQGLKKVLVGTQLANVPSLNLYEKLGFKVCDSNHVFHLHIK
jgi:ribosomal protein S18 acetylase RimI-like enzyme